jgi:hypothetical protein
VLYLGNLKEYREEMASYEYSLVTVEDLKLQLTDEEIEEVYDAENCYRYLQEESEIQDVNLVEVYTDRMVYYELNFSDTQTQMYEKLLENWDVQDEKTSIPVPVMSPVVIDKIDIILGIISAWIISNIVMLIYYERALRRVK